MSHPEIDPSQPEPSPDATQRLPVGPPADPYSTQRLDLSKHLGADSTVKLPLGVPEPSLAATQKLVVSRPDDPPLRKQKVDLPAEAEGQTQTGPLQPGAARPFPWKLPTAVGLLVVLGGIAYLAFPKRSQPQPLPAARVATPTESVPPSVQTYLDQANAGDTHAMRMLGVYYYNGLNVPQDREKGIYWYRKAAEKGSDAARAELNQIEGGR